jgi:hypothetical protein
VDAGRAENGGGRPVTCATAERPVSDEQLLYEADPCDVRHYEPGELEELMAEMTQRGMLNDPRGW